MDKKPVYIGEIKPCETPKPSVDPSKVRGGPGRVEIEIGRGLSKDRTYFIQKYGFDPLDLEDEDAEKEN